MLRIRIGKVRRRISKLGNKILKASDKFQTAEEVVNSHIKVVHLFVNMSGSVNDDTISFFVDDSFSSNPDADKVARERTIEVFEI